MAATDNVRKEFEGLTNDELAVQLAWLFGEIEERLDNYLQVAEESKEARDAGLVLAARVCRVANNEQSAILRKRLAFEAAGIYEVA